ncbi:MAG TPA: O-acetyl-ADP-ribose deacetylase [Pyrinomonadaceae bacterium]|jgi:O-acetyl-ADP-ribose deacetylase (regulator of RNase III)
MKSFLEGRVRVVVGDITRQATDAVVNAANSTLLGGGGVDGAIHRAGGARILEECRRLRATLYPDGLPTGEAVITTGGTLPARYVIHTVGPVWGQHAGREAELLAACYHNSLALAARHELTSIAFPAISTGVYSYPPDKAAVVASEAIREFLNVESGDTDTEARARLADVRLVFLSESNAEVFLRHHKFA